MKRRGFTLVELLMVIALIALLLAILVPGLVAIRRLAARARCQDNLKTISAGLHSYQAKHGVWPRRTSVTMPNEWDDGWFDQLFTEHLTDPRVFYCPDNSHDMSPPANQWDKSWSNRQTSYAILDGMPGPQRADDAGVPDGTNTWDFGDDSQGMRVYHRWRSLTGSSNYGSWEDRYPAKRPYWGSDWQIQNAPLVGDVCLEYTDGRPWIVNHGTSTSVDPLGQNILYTDGHANWVVPDNPSTVTAERLKQRLWRRIWKKDAVTYLRWVWNPVELQYPDVTERTD